MKTVKQNVVQLEETITEQLKLIDQLQARVNELQKIRGVLQVRNDELRTELHWHKNIITTLAENPVTIIQGNS